MNTNFTVTQGVEITTADFTADIHNDYNLCQIQFKILPNKQFDVFFEKNSSELNGPEGLIISFKDVKIITISDNFFMQPELRIDEIGFKEHGDSDYSWLLTKEEATPEADCIIFTTEGHHVRLCAASCVVAVASPIVFIENCKP